MSKLNFNKIEQDFTIHILYSIYFCTVRIKTHSVPYFNIIPRHYYNIIVYMQGSYVLVQCMYESNKVISVIKFAGKY